MNELTDKQRAALATFCRAGAELARDLDEVDGGSGATLDAFRMDLLRTRDRLHATRDEAEKRALKRFAKMVRAEITAHESYERMISAALHFLRACGEEGEQ